MFLTPPFLCYNCYRCPIIDAVKDLIDGLEQQIKDVILSPFDGSSASFNIDKITDPLIEYIDSALTNFTNNIVGDLNGTDCSSSDGTGRRLQESTNSSLADKIQNAIDSVNKALEDAGITIDGEVLPYFDGKTFAAGVSATLNVSFVQSAAGLLELIGDFFDDATANAQRLGIASTEMPSSSPSFSSEPTHTFHPSIEPSISASPSFEPSISFQPSISTEPSISVLPSVSLQPTPPPAALSVDFEQLLSKYGATRNCILLC